MLVCALVKILKESVYMLNTPLSPIGSLSRDLLLLLFSYLNWHDLPKAGVVSRLWQGIFNDPIVWKRLINEHFPYLSQKNQAQYQSSPKALFIQELKHIDTYINKEVLAHADQVKRNLLIALRGEVRKIEQLPITDLVKKKLYVFALANGHSIGLKESDIMIRTEALTIAAKNSYSPAVQKIVGLWGNDLTAWATTNSKLIGASANGRVDELQVLMQDPSFSGERMALRVAAEYGQLAVIHVLLTNVNRVIPNEHKDNALDIASTFGHVNVVQFLLPERGARLKAKQTALYSAAEYGQLNVVIALLTQVGDYSPENKAKALCIACEHGQLNVVQFLLNMEGITNRHKMDALLVAHKNNKHDIVYHISVDLSSWDPIPQDASLKRPLAEQSVALSLELGGKDKGGTLVIAAQNGHLPLVKALLKEERSAIPTNSKMEALIEADKHHFHEIVQLLKADLQSLRPAQHGVSQSSTSMSEPPLALSPLTVMYLGKRKENSETSQESESESKSEENDGTNNEPDDPDYSKTKRTKLN